VDDLLVERPLLEGVVAAKAVLAAERRESARQIVGPGSVQATERVDDLLQIAEVGQPWC